MTNPIYNLEKLNMAPIKNISKNHLGSVSYFGQLSKISHLEF